MKRFVIGFGIGLACLVALSLVIVVGIGLIGVAEHFLGVFAIPVVLGVMFCTGIGIVYATAPDGE